MNQNIIEAERWLAQAEHDMASAQWDMKGGFHESACFKMQQSTEKSFNEIRNRSVTGPEKYSSETIFLNRFILTPKLQGV